MLGRTEGEMGEVGMTKRYIADMYETLKEQKYIIKQF